MLERRFPFGLTAGTQPKPTQTLCVSITPKQKCWQPERRQIFITINLAKMKTNHTHEVRLQDYKKGTNHSEVLIAGTEQECLSYLDDEAKKSNCGVGLLLNNGGYSIVNLADERRRKVELVAPELLKALRNLVNEYEIFCDVPENYKKLEGYAGEENPRTTAMIIAKELIEKIDQ